MADKQSTKPARGTRDFLPDDLRRREYVIGIVREVYRRYGFEPLETPAFENIETLMGKYGEEGNQLIFKILKRGEHEKSGEADLALRYDLTVPLARVVAEYQGALPTLFKRYQIQPVWRADRPARGRFREFYQCDIDATGSTSPVVEVEILTAVSEILEKLGFTDEEDRDFHIRINHRDVLRGLLDSFGVPSHLHGQALVAIDKFEKIGADDVRAELLGRGVPIEAADGLVDSLRDRTVVGGAYGLDSINSQVLQLTRAKIEGHSVGIAGLENLSEIIALCKGTTAGKHVLADTSLARGLSYYTGAIMEIAVEGIGSLGGGGRYDNLVGMFLGRDVPACGFSLGLERIIVVMTERGMFPPSLIGHAVDIVVTFLDDGSRAEALRLAGELRRARYRVDVFPEASRKFEKPLKYASARGARAMAIFGENEVARGEVSVRNLETREQIGVARSEAVAAIATLLT